VATNTITVSGAASLNGGASTTSLTGATITLSGDITANNGLFNGAVQTNSLGDRSGGTLTLNPATALAISSPTSVTGALNATGTVTGGTLNTAGAISGGTLNTAGASSGGSLAVTNAISGTSLSITAGGPTNLTGTLSVSGTSTLAAANLSGNLGVTGATNLGGLTAGVTTLGATTLASLNSTGNATVGGTLGVTGATNLAALNTTGNTALGGTLAVSGTSTFNAAVAVVNAGFGVSNAGNNVFSSAPAGVVVGDAAANVAFTVNGATTITGNATVGGNLAVAGGATIGGDLAGGKFRGTCSTGAAPTTDVTCTFASALALAPAAVVVTPGGDYTGPATRYWVGVTSQAAFHLMFDAAPKPNITFYFVVVE